MSHERFSRLIRRWVYRVGQGGERKPVRTRNFVRLRLDEYEERIAPSITPIVAETRPISGGGEEFTSAIPTDNFHTGTQAAIHPTDPLRQVMVSSNATGIHAKYTIDGGQNWSDLLDLRDTPNSVNFDRQIDPARTDPASLSQRVYTNSSSPGVAMERDGQIYLVHLQHNAARTSGAVVVYSYSWPDRNSTPALTATRIVAQWVNTDPLFNPTIAVPNGIDVMTDPEAPANSFLNAMVTATGRAKAVYVAWNTNGNAPNGNDGRYGSGASLFNPNIIQFVSSSDRGLTFSSPTSVSGDSTGNGSGFGWDRGSTSWPENAAAPQIAFGPTGEMTVVWSRVTSEPGMPANTASLASHTVLPVGTDPTKEAVVVKSFQNTGTVSIGDAALPPSGNFHIAATTTQSIIVKSADLGATFDTLTDLDINLSLFHRDLSHVTIQLAHYPFTDATETVVDGVADKTVTLLLNRISGDGTNLSTGQPFPRGLPTQTDFGMGIGIGRIQNASISGPFGNGTVFNDHAARQINDAGANAGPFIGQYRPEVGTLTTPFLGWTAGEVAGKWELIITDLRNGPTVPPNTPSYQLRNFGVKFTAAQANDMFLGSGPDTLFANPGSGKIENALKGSFTENSTLTSPISPTFGIGPAVTIAYDHSARGSTLGGTRGRLYAAYTGNSVANPDIFLAWENEPGAGWGGYTRVNTDTKYDNVTHGDRPQILPSVAVDPVNGNVSVMWYDARNDASGTRLQTFIATSIDGGASFGEEISISTPKTARDLLTNTRITLETIPNNLAAAGARGFGNRAGSLMAFGGKLYPYWTGNDNDAKSLVYTATVQTAVGPQIIGGDMGPIIAEAKAGTGDNKITYNNTFNSDGIRELKGFAITFDRPIDPRTFDPLDVVVRFRGPGATAFDPALVPVASVYPISGKNTVNFGGNDVLIDANIYFVEFATPQSKVGTYSYAISPEIRDFSRTTEGVRLVPPTGPYAFPGGFKFAQPGGTVIPDTPDGLKANLVTPLLPAGQVIGDIRVRVNADTPAGLQLYLISPDSTKLTLAKGVGGGTNLINTTFDDYSVVSINSLAAQGPYEGFFRPTQPLGYFQGLAADGQWTLQVIGGGGQAILRDWTLTIHPGVANSGTNPAIGAWLDQDGDTRPLEYPGFFPNSNDVFANPKPISGTPFQLPYVSTTLPLIIPGPNLRPDLGAVGNLTEDNVTVNGTAGSTLDNLVLNAEAKTIDLRFDRKMDVTTFGKDDVIRIIGPFGTLYDRAEDGVANAPFEVTAQGDRTMRITFEDSFATTLISGQYSIELGSDIASSTGDLIDQNLNAGLFGLLGGDPFEQPRTLADTASYSAPAGPLAGGKYSIPAGGALSVPINITDEYVIRQGVGREDDDPRIQLRLSVTHPNSSALQAWLVSPDGFRIKLFTGVGSPTTPLQGFSGILDDAAGVPIQALNTEFPTEPFSPQFPLSQLSGRSSLGTWRLEIRNGSGSTGTLNSWGMTLPFTTPNLSTQYAPTFQGKIPPTIPGVTPPAAVNISTSPTGLGELNADRISVGFRIFNQDPSNPVTRQVWTPIGPTSMNGQTNAANNAGRVSAMAVDPSDPSGNTVYIGAATGGVWKSTNFLTTNPSGPVWVPLTDFGPTNALNIGSIALYPVKADPNDPNSPFDPNKTIVFALTGDGSNIGQNVMSPNPGVGVLRSTDAGRTWTVLDSTQNTGFGGNTLPIDSPQRNRTFFGSQGMRIIADPRLTPVGQANVEAGGEVYQGVLLYMAVTGGGQAAGVWRSQNGGDSWTRILTGNATDVVLSAGSAGTSGGNGNLEILYAAIQGVGVYYTSEAPSVTLGGMQIASGGQGNPLVRNVGWPPTTPGIEVGVNLPGTNPGNSSGRITLAVPTLTDNQLQNSVLAGWLYAVASNADGSPAGFYMTKDFGRNWTQIQLPVHKDINPNTLLPEYYASNNETGADVNIFTPAPLPRPVAGQPSIAPSRPPQGNYNLSLTVDPNNPNIVYMAGLGSSNGLPGVVGGSIRIDVTKVNDPQSFVNWDNTAGGAGTATQFATVGAFIPSGDTKSDPPTPPPPPGVPVATGQAARSQGIIYTPGNTFYADRPNVWPTVAPFTGVQANVGQGPGYWYGTGLSYDTFVYSDFINLQRDPDNPFVSNVTIRTLNTKAFANDGQNASWTPFHTQLAGANDVSQIVSFTDPLSGKTRLIYGTDHGVFTGVDDGTGQLLGSVGFAKAPTFSRNGNLQIVQFNSGAIQPSQLAADVAGALLYGMSRDNGFPVSSRDILQTGNLNWTNPLNDPFLGGRFDPTGVAVAVDPQASGSAFQHRWPGLSGPGIGLPTDFFRFFAPNTDHSQAGASRTTGLLQGGDNPGQNVGQWPLGNETIVGNFAINPYDNKGLAIGSNSARIFRSTNQGQNWFSIGLTPDGLNATSLAFGSPVNHLQALNNFLYVGTAGGNMFMTYDPATQQFTGQGPFVDITNGALALDPSPIVKIVPNPAHNSREVFVATQQGVYYLDDAVGAISGKSQWVSITGNLFGIQRPSMFGEEPTSPTVVTTNKLQSISSIAVDWRNPQPIDPTDEKSPILPSLYVSGDGGVFRSRELSLIGNSKWSFFPDVENESARVDGGYLPNAKIMDLDLSIGKFNVTNVDPNNPDRKLLYLPSDSLNMLVATTYGRGAFVIRLPANSAPGPQITKLENPNPTGPTSNQLFVYFNSAIDPNTFTPADVELTDPDGNPVTVTGVTLATTPLPGQPDPSNKFLITFADQTNPPDVGLYRITIGPDVTDLAGNQMDQDGDFGTPGGANGEIPEDIFSRFVYLNGDVNSVLVTGIPLPNGLGNSVIAGESKAFAVTIIDSLGNTITNYDGTISITITDPNSFVNGDPAGTPNFVTYSYLPADQGSKVFTVEFQTAGEQFINVSATPGVSLVEANDGKLATLVIADVASKLVIDDYATVVTAGESKPYRVTAFDKFGNQATEYTGTVTFTSSDTGSQTVLPTEYTFVAADNGQRVFDATLTKAGLQTITVTDQVNNFVAVTDPAVLVEADVATGLFVTNLPPTMIAGVTKQFTITAKDQFGNTADGFTGLVDIATAPEAGAAQATYQFTGADAGVANLDVTFTKAGQQSVTVSTTEPGVAASAPVFTLVNPADAASFMVAGFPSPVTAGETKQFSVTAFDAFGNKATGYAGTVRFTTTDTGAATILPADAKLTSNGFGIFQGTLTTAGLQSITATDVQVPSVTGKQENILVQPAAANGLFITGLPGSVQAGEEKQFVVTAKDVFGNQATGFTGTVQFTSTDPQAGLPGPYTFDVADQGVRPFDVTFKTAGPRSIQVSAPGSIGVNPGSAGTTVLAGPASVFEVTPLPESMIAGELATFSVTVKDEFDNLVTNYDGTVTFGSSDAQAVLPAPYTFSSLDKGTANFAVSLRTAGDQTVTVSAAGVSGSPAVLTTNVRASLATSFEVSGGPPAITAGDLVNVNITARDDYGNIATGYNGLVRFTSTDLKAALPPDSPLTNGQGQFTGVLKTAGDQFVNVFAPSNPELNGSVPVTVSAAGATSFVLSGITGPVTAGVPVSVGIVAKDQFGNLAVGYDGLVNFTSTDPEAILPPNTSLVGGMAMVSVTFATEGTQSLTARDTVNDTTAGTLAGITVVLPPPPPNTPPQISDINDIDIRINQNTGPIAFTVADDFTPLEELVITATSSNSVLIPLSGIVFSGTGADRTMIITPVDGKTGSSVVTITVQDAAGLTATDEFTITVLAGAQPPTLIGSQQYAVGTDAGGSPTVRVFNPDGSERHAFTAFDPAFTGGVRTAMADFNNDGIADIVVGSGPGIATFVRVLDGVTLQEIFQITPFETTFTGGVFVSAGDLNGDGIADLVISPDQGGGPRVRVFNGTNFQVMADFLGIADPNFRGGARTAIGDVNGDGLGDLIVAAGFQGGPRVAGFDGRSVSQGTPVNIFNDFFAFEQDLRNGVYIAAGDIDGDGFAEVIAGGGPGGGPRILAFSGKGLLAGQQQTVANFFGGDTENRGGVRITVKDLDGDSLGDLVVGDGELAGTRVSTYLGKTITPTGTPPVALDFEAFTRFNGGVFVG